MSSAKKQFSHSLQKKLIILTMTIALGIGIFSSFIAFIFYGHYAERTLIHSTDVNMRLLTNTIDSNLEHVFQLMRWCQINTYISDYVSNDSDKTYYKYALAAHDRLQEEYQNSIISSYIKRIVVGNKDGRFIQVVPSQYSKNANLGYIIPKEDYFDSLISADGIVLSAGFVSEDFSALIEKEALPIIRPVRDNSNEISGWAYISILDTLFTDPLEYYSCHKDSVLCLKLNDHLYRLTPEGLSETGYPVIFGKELYAGELSDGSHAYRSYTQEHRSSTTVVVKELKQPGCCILQTIPDSELHSQYSMLYLLLAMIFVILILFGIVLVMLMHNHIEKPVSRLQAQLKEVSQGHFERNPDIEWNNELGDIGKGINDLSQNVESLINRRILDEQEKKDLEYQVLQNQINPHFIFNTLASIKWMAIAQGATGIADITTSLSHLFKSISKGTTSEIKLSEELSLIQDYFKIQKYRYGGTISMETEIEDSSLEDALIHKFTLQPMVENAIFHGLEPKGTSGRIRLIIHTITICDEPALEITVWDNGVGISPDKLDTILTDTDRETHDFFKSTGIINVNKRLIYSYGPEYGVHVESVLGEYTAMHIRIPLKFN